MAIWDDLKPFWQLNGTPLAKRSKVNVVDRHGNLQSPALMTDGPDRVDFTPPETSPLYIYSTVAAPFSATGDDLWLAPYGQLSDLTAIYTPIGRRQVLSVITFHIVSSPLLTDSVQIDVFRASTSVPTGLTLTVPPNTLTTDFLVSAEVPVTFEVGEGMALRLRQSGTALQAGWNAYIVVG